MRGGYVWTEDKVQFLKESFSILENEEIANKLGVSHIAINSQAYKIGLRKKNKLSKSNKEDCKTIAWSLDFEGTLSIIKSKHKNQTQGFHLNPVISLYNTDYNLIKGFKNLVNCGTIFKRERRNIKHSNSYVWRITTFSQIISLVDNIIQYSPTDKFKRKCEIIKEYCISRKEKGNIRKSYSQNEINLQKEIKILNEKGKNV